MPNPLSPLLRPLGLDPSQGFDTAAAGAKEAQGQANALSDLQWQRQMGGLNQAQGYTNQLQSLYNSIYSPGGGQTAAGGTYAPASGQGSAMGMLLPPQKQSAPASSGGLGSLGPTATNDILDFVPGLGTANRISQFAQDPSWSTAGRAAASFVPGANAAYDAGKALWNKVF